MPPGRRKYVESVEKARESRNQGLGEKNASKREQTAVEKGPSIPDAAWLVTRDKCDAPVEEAEGGGSMRRLRQARGSIIALRNP
jgi:hypothetical protein